MKKILGTTLLLLLGLASGARVSQTRLSRQQANLDFAETGATQTTHSCPLAINRIKAGPANFNTIIGSGSAFTDATFTPSADAVRWSDMPGADNLS